MVFLDQLGGRIIAQQHKQVYAVDPKNQDHKAQLSHEVIGGAAAFDAAKAYEEHCAKSGKPSNRAKAQELLNGLAGTFVDRIVEIKGLDSIDREMAKRTARQQADQTLKDIGHY